MERLDLLPDAGRDVLGDKCFAEVFDHFMQFDKRSMEQDYPSSSSAAERVHYLITSGEPFDTTLMSPPPRHLSCIFTEKVHLESLQRCLRTSPVCSLFIGLMGDLHQEQFYESLGGFLRTQPAHLQSLGVLISNEHIALTGRLLDALMAAQRHCKVENLWLLFYSREFKLAELKEAQLGALKRSFEHLGRCFRSLWLLYIESEEKLEETSEETSSAVSEEITGSEEDEEEKENKGTNASYTSFMNCIAAPVIS